VIIANYLQGASNCIISTSHYRVCCANECEDFLADLELVAGSAFAPPSTILPLVKNMSATLDDDVPNLVALVAQLLHIAEMHDGNIPLHGRLFAQWMHYVFPRECAFPHIAGTIKPSAPSDFGENHLATKHEMKSHVSNATKPRKELTDEAEEDWMSQWSYEEELLFNHGHAHLQAPGDTNPIGRVTLLLLGTGILLCSLTFSRSSNSGKPVSGLLPSVESKYHLI